MKLKQTKKLMAILFTFCMTLSFMPIYVFAAEGDTNITEININGVSNELWSHKDVTFATVEENSHYTIKSQKWFSSEENTITSNSTNLKPTAGECYTFNIQLDANDGYVFPIKPESGVFYDGTFKVNGNQCDNSAITVTSNGKTLNATLFSLTKVKKTTDSSGGSGTEVKTTVRDNYTDSQVTDDINLEKGSDYIIDFTKEDNLSMALRSMADLEKTKYYKFANSDNNSLIKTETASEALIKIVGNKSENKAIMTLVSNINKNTSYALKFMRTQYTGSKLTYTGTEKDEKTGKNIIYEIRDDYYTRYYFDCKLNIIVNSTTTSSTPSSEPSSSYKITEGENSAWVQNTDENLTFRANGDFSKFTGVKIDDKWVDKENYTAVSGSTVVTLKNEYLEKLSEGNHKLTIAYKDGECDTNFEIKKVAEEEEEEEETYENSDTASAEEKEEQNENSLNPTTGDNIGMLLWISLLLINFLGMLEMAIYCRRKNLINL